MITADTKLNIYNRKYGEAAADTRVKAKELVLIFQFVLVRESLCTTYLALKVLSPFLLSHSPKQQDPPLSRRFEYQPTLHQPRCQVGMEMFLPDHHL